MLMAVGFSKLHMLRLMYLKANVNSSTDCQDRVHSTVRLLSQKLQRQWRVAFFGSISTVRFYHPLRAEREIKLMKARIPHSPARKQNKPSSGHCCCPAAPVDIYRISMNIIEYPVYYFNAVQSPQPVFRISSTNSATVSPNAQLGQLPGQKRFPELGIWSCGIYDIFAGAEISKAVIEMATVALSIIQLYKQTFLPSLSQGPLPQWNQW